MAIDLIEESDLQPLTIRMAGRPAPQRKVARNSIEKMQQEKMESQLDFLGIGDDAEEDRIREAQERAARDFPLPPKPGMCEDVDRAIAACKQSIEANRRTMATGCDRSCQRVNNREIGAKELQLGKLQEYRANANCDLVLQQKADTDFLVTSTALLNAEEDSQRADLKKGDWMIYAIGAIVLIGLGAVIIKKSVN